VSVLIYFRSTFKLSGIAKYVNVYSAYMPIVRPTRTYMHLSCRHNVSLLTYCSITVVVFNILHHATAASL